MNILEKEYFDQYQEKIGVDLAIRFDNLKKDSSKIDLEYLTEASAVYSSNIEGNPMDLNSFMNAKAILQKMKKDFQGWHIRKEKLHERETDKKVYFYEREIWWCCLGLNIGFEQDGKNDQFERPVLVLKRFNKDVLWILPLTSKNKTGKYYYQFEYKGRKYSVILSQLRLISSKRLLRKIRTFSWDDFNEVRKLVKDFI